MILLGIAWHWPGTTVDVIGVESEAATANRLRGYRRFHVTERGWSDVGYNFAIDQAGRVWDLRGLGRVGAHCASPSNPDANHEWMGVLLILGDREVPSAAMMCAAQDFVHVVFLPRWPGRTRDTGHGREPGVPGAQTSCPGPFAAELIADGVLTQRPEEEDDMFTDEDRARLHRLDEVINSFSDEKVVRPDVDGKTAGMRYALQRVWFATYNMQAGQLSRILANQHAIMAAQGVEVDEAAIAQQVAAIVTPAVVAELGDETGADPDEVEERAERAVRRVLGSLDDASV